MKSRWGIVLALTLGLVLIIAGLAPGEAAQAQREPGQTPGEQVIEPIPEEAVPDTQPYLPAEPRADAENVEWVGHIGGASLAVAVQGNYAYVGEGARLAILNISNPAKPVLVGRSPFLPDEVREVAIAGNYAYVAASDGGLRIINVTNPAVPTEVGFYDTPGRSRSVAVAGDYAYIADEHGGLRIINIANPATPTQASVYNTPGNADGVAVAGNYAYVAAGDYGLRIINIANPAAPTEIGFFAGLAYDVAVAGNYAYVAAGDGGLRIINVADPSKPKETGSVNTPGNADGVAVVGNYAYVAAGGYGLRIINIANPAAPTEIGFFAGLAYDVAVAGNYAYIADGSAGLRIIDISKPTTPTQVGIFNTSGGAWDVAVAGNYAYVADQLAGLRIINIANPAAPTEVGFFAGLAYDVTVAGNYAYVAGGGDSGLRIINVADPSKPKETGSFDTYALGVTVAGNYAYVADLYSGLLIINIANPAAPSLDGSYGFQREDWAEDVAVVGDYAYVANNFGLLILNVANPAKPTRVSSYEEIGNATGVDVAGNYAFVTDWGRSSLERNGLWIINVADPAKPKEAGFLETPGLAEDVIVSGNYAYVADGGSGLRIIDISEPTVPTEVGFYITPGHGRSVAVAGGYTFLANGNSGLMILRFTGGSQPTYSISGKVTMPNGTPLQGALVSAGSKSAMTNASGNYTISGLTTGTYTIVPSMGGYTFTPASRSVTVPPNGTAIDFTATQQGGSYTISGKVTMQNGTPLQGVVVSAGFGIHATTNAKGEYTINNLPAGTYDVGGTQTGFTFVPINTIIPPSKDTINLVGISEYDFDTGFRPNPNGYSFANSNLLPPKGEDFTLLDLQRMFGNDRVCLIAGPVGQPCNVTNPLAALWHFRSNTTARKAGMCAGMAATSQMYFQGQGGWPNSFESTFALTIPASRRDIAYFHVMQTALPVQDYSIEQKKFSDPAKTLNELRNAMIHGDQVILGMSDGAWAHAVNPYALDEQTDGLWHIRVYDNERPNNNNSIVVINEQKNTWAYYDKKGDAHTHSLFVIPLELFTGPQQPPNWWGLKDRTREAAELSQSDQGQVWLTGGGHLLITDSTGRRTGYVSGSWINEIPDSIILPVFGGVTETEPIYQITLNEDYAIQLIGQAESSPDTVSLTQFGLGYGVSVENIALNTSTKDEFYISTDGTFIDYEASSTAEPNVLMVFSNELTSHQFEILGADVGKGQTVSVQADLVDKWLIFDSENAKGGAYNLAMTIADTSMEHQFNYENIQINSGDTHYIDFLELEAGGPVYLGIDVGSDGTLDDYFELEETTSGGIYLPVILRPSDAPSQPPLSFVYPQNGQTLNFEGDYLFKVIPYPNAEGYLWGFFQNGQYVWENMTEEGTLDGPEYAILSGTEAHNRFRRGAVEVWVRASINENWTEPTIITIYLE